MVTSCQYLFVLSSLFVSIGKCIIQQNGQTWNSNQQFSMTSDSHNVNAIDVDDWLNSFFQTDSNSQSSTSNSNAWFFNSGANDGLSASSSSSSSSSSSNSGDAITDWLSPNSNGDSKQSNWHFSYSVAWHPFGSDDTQTQTQTLSASAPSPGQSSYFWYRFPQNHHMYAANEAYVNQDQGQGKAPLNENDPGFYTVSLRKPYAMALIALACVFLCFNVIWCICKLCNPEATEESVDNFSADSDEKHAIKNEEIIDGLKETGVYAFAAPQKEVVIVRPVQKPANGAAVIAQAFSGPQKCEGEIALDIVEPDAEPEIILV